MKRLFTISASLLILLCGCTHQGSQIDTGFLSRLSSPSQDFTMNVPFAPGTSSDYSLSDSTRIELTNGVVRLKPANQTDTDNSSTGFACGTMTGLQWDSSLSTIRLSTTTNLSRLDASWTPGWSQIAGYWPMDGTVGGISDGDTVSSVVGSRDATANGSGLSYVTGQLSQAIAFDGSDYLNVSNSDSLDGTNQFSIAFWVYPTTLDGSPRGLICKRYSSTNSESYCIFFYNGNRLNVDIEGSGDRFSTNTVFQTDRWYHIVIVFDGTAAYASRAKVYVNGRLDITASEGSTSLSNNSSSVVIGGMQANGAVDGDMDDVAVWKGYALSADDVSTIYDRQVSRYSGQLISRVMDAQETGSTDTSWTSLSVNTTLPFYKELSGASGSETSGAYPSINGDLMNDIEGLWHFDESTYNGSSGEIADASGKGRDGTGASGLSSIEGRFGRGLSFQSGSSAATVSTGADYIASADHPLTVSAWIEPSSISSTAAPSNTIVEFPSSSSSDDLVLGLGSGNKLIYYNSGDGATHVSSQSVSLDRWTLASLTYNGSCFQIYINGKSDGTCTSASLPAASSDKVHIGKSLINASDRFDGHIDEVAIWSRALSSAEILELYRRGANRLTYQVRTCASADCSDQDGLTSVGQGWKGPDGTASSYFSELYNTAGNALGAAVTAAAAKMTFSQFSGLSLSANRYFQYRAVFESDDANALCTYSGSAADCSPELKTISIGPDHFDTIVQSVTTSAAIGAAYQTLDTNGFAETLGTNGCGSGVKYALSGNGTDFYYWNGGTWAVSSDDTTASPATDIQSHIDSLPTSAAGIGTLQIRAYLKSDGTAACEIDNLKITGSSD